MLNQIHKYRLHVIALFAVLLYRAYGTQDITLLMAMVSGFAYAYLINKVFDYEEDLVSQPEHANQGNYLFVGLTLLIALWPFLVVGKSWPLYLLFLVLGTIYSMPFYKGFRIKNILVIKNAWSAVVGWCLPFLILDLHFYEQYYLQNYLPIFFFVMAIEMLWDMRDVDGDRKNKVNTVPVVFGWNVTKAIIISTLAINYFFFNAHLFITVFIGLSVLAFRTTTNNIWYHLLLYVIIGLLLL